MSDRPVRKYIRLENFDYDSDGAYFITICTVNKECMLSTIVGGGAFDAPQNILTEYGTIVEKYVISSNSIGNTAQRPLGHFARHLLADFPLSCTKSL